MLERQRDHEFTNSLFHATCGDGKMNVVRMALFPPAQILLQDSHREEKHPSIPTICFRQGTKNSLIQRSGTSEFCILATKEKVHNFHPLECFILYERT